MVNKVAQPRIGDILVQTGQVTRDQVKEALKFAKERGCRVGEALVQLGYIDDDKVTWALGNQLEISYVDLQWDMVDWSFLLKMPVEQLMPVSMLPISEINNEVTVVVADPARPGLSDAIATIFPNCSVTINLSSERSIRRFLKEIAFLQEKENEAINEKPIPRPFERKSFAFEEQDKEAVQDYIGLIDGQHTDGFCIATLAPAHESVVFLDDEATNMAFTSKDAELLSQRFNDEFYRQFDLPGGFCGMRPARPGLLHKPVRAISVCGLSGWLLVARRIQDPFESKQGYGLLVLHGKTPTEAKECLYDFLSNDEKKDQMPSVSIEMRSDDYFERILQVEIPDSDARLLTASHLAETAIPWVVVEVDSDDQLAKLASFHLGRLIALWRNPFRLPKPQGKLFTARNIDHESDLQSILNEHREAISTL